MAWSTCSSLQLLCVMGKDCVGAAQKWKQREVKDSSKGRQHHWKGWVDEPDRLDCKSAPNHVLGHFPSLLNKFLGTLVLPGVVKVSARRLTPGSALTPTLQPEARAGLRQAGAGRTGGCRRLLRGKRGSGTVWHLHSPAARGLSWLFPWYWLETGAARRLSSFGVPTSSPLNTAGSVCIPWC